MVFIGSKRKAFKNRKRPVIPTKMNFDEEMYSSLKNTQYIP